MEAEPVGSGCNNTNAGGSDAELKNGQSSCLGGEEEVVAEQAVEDSAGVERNNNDPQQLSNDVVLSQGTVRALEISALEWDDGPSFNLFPDGSENDAWLKGIPFNATKVPPPETFGAGTSNVLKSSSPGPTFDKTPRPEGPSKAASKQPELEPKGPNDQNIPSPVFDVSPILVQKPFSAADTSLSQFPKGPPAGLGETKDVIADTSSHGKNLKKIAKPNSHGENLEKIAEPSSHGKNLEKNAEPSSHGKNLKKNAEPSSHEKNLKKRVVQSPESTPRMKKIRIDAVGDALHQQYGMNRYSIKKPKRGETLPDFIDIDGFHTSLHNFHASLKPRAEIDTEVMNLYLKTFNHDQLGNRKKPKKYAFSVMMSGQLAVDPNTFNPKVCEKEFRKACKKNEISQSDLLFFVVVNNRHWAVVCVNIPQKEFNVFDSIKNSKDC